MKKILGLGLSLMIAGGLMGCETTGNNANLRNTNTNTGYMANNANTPSSTPMMSPSPMANSNMGSNGKPSLGANSNTGSKMNTNANANSKMSNKPGNK